MDEAELLALADSVFTGELLQEVHRMARRDLSAHQARYPTLEGAQRTEQMLSAFYESVGTGTFFGQATVVWQDMDLFLFPAGAGALSFHTSAKGPKANRVIQPRRMWTDGGSIPLILRGFSRKLSPWSYGPAFITHDWLFVAHRCGIAPDTDFTLEDAALVMAEGQKTLMEVGYTRSDGTVHKLPRAKAIVYLMHKAVSSFVARRAWEKPPEAGECLV
jgi:hypothetical protein